MRILPITLLILSSLIFNARSQDAPAVDTKTILEALKTIKEKQQTESKSGRSKILQELSAAGASTSSATEFYMEAVRATQFAGENREQTQFREWKKKESDKLRDPGMQNAARLHLNYLVLTLQRAGGAEIKDLIPALVNYTKQVSADENSLWDQDLMKRSLNDSIFVRWYQLTPLIANVKDWEMTPGNVDGIFQKTILPVLRKKKDARLLEYWDNKILNERNKAQQSQRAFNADIFEQTRKPALLWSRAEDELAIGLRNRAVGDMFAIIKSYPAHAEIERWITRLEAILAGAGPEVTPTEEAPKPQVPPTE